MALERVHTTSADGTFSGAGATAWNAAHGVTGAVSGGIPYFDSTTSEASSALLAANAAVMGGGAGTAPYSSTKISEGTAAGQGLIVAAGTATTAVLGASFSQIVNAGSTVVNSFDFARTDTASGANSSIFRFLGGSAGTRSAIQARADAAIVTVNSNLYLCGNTAAMGYATPMATMQDRGANIGRVSLSSNSASFFCWAAGNDASGTPTTTLYNPAAGVIAASTNGAATDGSFRGKYQSSDGTDGVAAFGPAGVASITVKDGIIVAIS